MGMSSETDQCKREQRNRLRALRKSLGQEQRLCIDAKIEQRLLSLPEFQTCELLLTYLDFGSEVRTRGIIQAAWDRGKLVALPRCVPHSREMRWYCVTSLDSLVRSPLGVEEPPADEGAELPVGSSCKRDALALVPGLAFDERGFRLGYGGGFYDTFLARFAGRSVGLCRECQMVDDLAALKAIDSHDLAVDMLVTEGRCVRPNA